MCRDCYELDLPETTSWVDSLKENKDTVKVVGTTVGVPTILFVLISIANRWISKNWSAL